jgi:hypothetical protein
MGILIDEMLIVEDNCTFPGKMYILAFLLIFKNCSLFLENLKRNISAAITNRHKE